MIRKPFFTFLPLCFAAWTLCAAQDPVVGQPTPLTFAQRVTFESKVLDETRTFDIFLPESFHEASPDHTYPVVLLLEGEFFLPVAGAVRHLGSVERMPDSIVVSIPTFTDNYYAPNYYLNGSNFWPKEWERFSFDGPAEKFTAFFRRELFPYLKKHYRANRHRTIIGTSATAAYVFHAFCREPGLFKAHVAIAAGDFLGMGYEPGKTLIDEMVRSMEKEPERDAILYVASTKSDAVWAPEIETNLAQLHQKLAPYGTKKLTYISELVDDPGHYDIVLPSFLKVVEMMYPKARWSVNFQELEKKKGNALQHIDAHYRALSQDLGFTVLPKADRWNSGDCLRSSGTRLLRQGRVEEAIQVLRRWTGYRPHSPKAHMALAKALKVAERFKEAISTQKKAVALAKQRDAAHLDKYQELLNSLTGKAKAHH
ncbi:hypothetical protein SCOR_07630 [Sulfidibacter corallicola]|uniref:Esterase n=1 Tax=Sulfidibacter corallicola TaxID=2818388 RepID=A0A8A4TN21_SULCO|nr:alpha/beta hydrolase-fold protein [Sulfidibacter corallicola]QTD51366.1 hypothetical protein J3U87_02760 [Sulfidibacter corallicola]